MLILLAEDSKTLALALKRKFELMGHDVAIAADGRAAVDWFASGQPDLVVMDIEMPRMGGFEAVRRIRDIEAGAWKSNGGAWTPIIFLTATDTVQNLMMAIESGGDDFLAKTAPDQVLGAKIGAMGRIAAMMRRMRELRLENVALAVEAGTDALTGLANRRALESRLDQADAQGGAVAALMVDVDHFKKYNDALGHAAGDKCLARVGQELGKRAAELGGGAFAARYGGEEFVLLVPGAGREQAMEVAWSVCSMVERGRMAHPGNGKKGIVSVSVGASSAWVGTAAREALRRADQALYEAKKAGRAQACWLGCEGSV